MPVLERYSWPGNVRELRNVVERMAILTAGDRITVESIPLEIRLPQSPRSTAGLQETRDSAERERIRQALDQTDWNVSGAARLLGTERTSLHKRIRTLGLKRTCVASQYFPAIACRSSSMACSARPQNACAAATMYFSSGSR